MRPYSNDFRLKIVRAYERGEGSQRDLARLCGVSLSLYPRPAAPISANGQRCPQAAWWGESRKD
jgi:transposase